LNIYIYIHTHTTTRIAHTLKDGEGKLRIETSGGE
jgi:hypothetical protein